MGWPSGELQAAFGAIADDDLTPAMVESAREIIWRRRRRDRAGLFPISDDLAALVALVMADLSESQ